MSAAKHTPGPWREGNGRKFGSCTYVVAEVPLDPDPFRANGDTAPYYGGYLIAESIAPQNVPIIAAAPDLLRACLIAMAYCFVERPGDIVFEGEQYSEHDFLAVIVSNALGDALAKAGVDIANLDAQEIVDLTIPGD